MKKLGFIGAGNMAEALARGLLAKKVFSASQMIASDVDSTRRRKFTRATKVTAVTDNLAVTRDAAAIVLAVKPQNIDAVLDALAPAFDAAPRAGKNRLFISIAAGVPLARLERHLPAGTRVIRVMPNAPAMIGCGMAALVRGSSATSADERFALRIFQAVGEAVALKDEAQLDAVTALSGSGPAYVYLFVKALSDSAAREGLPPKLALTMALQTMLGASFNMRQSKLSPDELIRIVASPGGTTEAALRQFNEGGFAGLVGRAVAAAAARSRELGRAS